MKSSSVSLPIQKSFCGCASWFWILPDETVNGKNSCGKRGYKIVDIFRLKNILENVVFLFQMPVSFDLLSQNRHHFDIELLNNV